MSQERKHHNLYSAKSIANKIINFARKKGSQLTNPNIQRLLYFAQGLCLAKYNHPLFKETIYAWSGGPCIPSLYDAFEKECDSLRNGLPCSNCEEISETATEMLNFLCDNMGDYNDDLWRAILSDPSSPWALTLKRGDGLYQIISRKLMANYFCKIFKMQ